MFDEDALRAMLPYPDDTPEENFEALTRAVARIMSRYPIPPDGHTDLYLQERSLAVQSAIKVLVGDDSLMDASLALREERGRERRSRMGKRDYATERTCLQEAAGRIRELALKAADPPWTAIVYRAKRDIYTPFTGKTTPKGTPVSFEISPVAIQEGDGGGVNDLGSAYWIALMSPEIAEPLAVWMEEESLFDGPAHRAAVELADLTLRGPREEEIQ